MNFRQRFSAFLLAYLFLTLLSSAANKQQQVSDAFAAAEANFKTTAGKQYDSSFGKELSANYMASVKQCKDSLPAGSKLEPFDILLKLGVQGKVQEVLLYPEVQLSSCVRTALLPATFSNPPHGNYWVNVHLNFKQ